MLLGVIVKLEFSISWIATFIQLTLRLSWGVIAVVFASILNLNSVEIGTVLSLFYAGYISSSVIWGFYIDYVGPKKIIFISSLLSGVVLIPILFIRNLWGLYLVYFIEGLTTAGLFPSSMKVVSLISNQVTRYVSLLESSAPIVLLVVSLLSSVILDYWWYFYLVMIIVFCLISLISLRLRINHTPNKEIKKVIFNRKMLKTAVIRAGELWGTWGTSSWLFPFLVLYDGISRFYAEVLFFSYSLGQFISIILASRTRNERLTVEASLITFIVLSIVIAFIRLIPVLIPIAFILGLSSFLYRPTTDSLIIKLMGRENTGKSMGLANAVSQVGSLTAPLFVGTLIYMGLPGLAIAGLSLGPIISLALLMTL